MPERRLVEHQALRLAHERAADGEHLLLASAQRARGLFFAFLQPRENAEDILKILRHARLVVAQVGAHAQVFHHCEIGKDHAALGRLRETSRDDLRAAGIA